MRVIGIDPGLDRTGWAVIEKNGANQPVLLASGLIHTPSRTPVHERLKTLYDRLCLVVQDSAPEEAAIEEMFFIKATATQEDTLQARGVILLALAKAGLPITGYNPKVIKKTISGSGTALKPQMQRMVQLTLKLAAVPSPDDIADAMAAALCHMRISPYRKAVAAVRKKIKTAGK